MREAKQDDAAAIAGIHVRSWRVAYRGIVPDAILDGFSIPKRTGFWANALRHAAFESGQTNRIWVVEEAGTVAGFATTRRCPDDDVPQGTGELHSIYLAPEAWSRQLGTILLRAAVDDLHERGFDPLVLWVIEANERGRQFYERHGWRPDGARQPIDFDGVLVDEIRYRQG